MRGEGSSPDPRQIGATVTDRSGKGLVATSHHLASRAGADILDRGGTAVDAAIAANAVLVVAYPHMAGLGGDGFWLLHEPGSEPVAINASGTAAAAATADFYRSRGHETSPPARGPLAALTVPGAVDGWRLAHERYGRVSWGSLFDAAIELADTGVEVAGSLARWLQTDADLLLADPGCVAVFAPGGAVLRRGERFAQHQIAQTLRSIAELGPREGFYDGPLARGLGASLERAGSPLRAVDLQGYTARWDQPLTRRYGALDLWQLPPNSQGVTFLQMLGMWDVLDGGSLTPGSAEWYHLGAEVVKLAIEDRNQWLGDPDFTHVPVEQLLDEQYLARRAELIRQDVALQPGALQPGIMPDRPAARTEAQGDTCYFCVVDGDGLSASVIQSVYFDFGSAHLDLSTGIILQNRGACFKLQGSAANGLLPGKRPFHTLMPGLATRNGDAVLVFGAMGGEGQPQTSLALTTRILDHGEGPAEAIDAPRWLYGKTWGDDAPAGVLLLEQELRQGVAEELVARGHSVALAPSRDERLGHAQAILLQDTALVGAADPRGDGAAVAAG